MNATTLKNRMERATGAEVEVWEAADGGFTVLVFDPAALDDARYEAGLVGRLGVRVAVQYCD